MKLREDFLEILVFELRDLVDDHVLQFDEMYFGKRADEIETMLNEFDFSKDVEEVEYMLGRNLCEEEITYLKKEYIKTAAKIYGI